MRTVTLAAPKRVGKPTTTINKGVRLQLEEYAKLLAKFLKLPKPTIRLNAKTSGKTTYHALEFGKDLTELRIFVDPIKGKMYGQAVSKKWKDEFPTTALQDIKKYLGMDKDTYFDRYKDAIIDFAKKLSVAIKPYGYKVSKPKDTGIIGIGKNNFVTIESDLPFEVRFDPKANGVMVVAADKSVLKAMGGSKVRKVSEFFKIAEDFLEDYEE